MSKANGDKARYNRERRKKLARRVKARMPLEPVAAKAPATAKA